MMWSIVGAGIILFLLKGALNLAETWLRNKN